MNMIKGTETFRQAWIKGQGNLRVYASRSAFHGLGAGGAGIAGGERDQGEEGDGGAQRQGVAGLHAVQ